MPPRMPLGNIQCDRKRRADFRKPNNRRRHKPLLCWPVVDCLRLDILWGIWERHHHGVHLSIQKEIYVHKCTTDFWLF